MTRNQRPAPIDAIRLLGVRIDAFRLDGLLAAVREALADGRRLTVLYVNVHCMNVAADDRRYAAVLDAADIVYCDGTGVRLGARLAGMHLPERMTGADWIDDLCRMAAREDLRLFLVGGEPGVAGAAAIRLKSRHPGLLVVGAESGYDAGPQVFRAICTARPDILLVGMGTPAQELWIQDHRHELAIPVVWAVGALFDFVTDRIPRGPRLLTDNGLEWLCRFAAEPRKLWRRYLIGNPRFLWRIARQYWFSRPPRASRPRGSGQPRAGGTP